MQDFKKLSTPKTMLVIVIGPKYPPPTSLLDIFLNSVTALILGLSFNFFK